MKILVLSGDVWNDKINGNNINSNWFEGIKAEFANIYCSPGEPCNKCCFKYFQITDAMMAKSIFLKKKAGVKLKTKDLEQQGELVYEAEQKPQRLYELLKRISGSYLRLIRELIWIYGKYNTDEMREFIEDFQPDIIFSERMASGKMLRLEKVVLNLCNVPIVAFTGDDEYSLRQLSFSPFFWINRLIVRKMLRDMVKRYHIYYTLSYEQKREYEKLFACQIKILQKCGEFERNYHKKVINKPIKLVYAGKLYCNRWKVLSEIASCLKKINKDEIRIVLEIYTKDKITKHQKKLLHDRKNIFIKGSVSQEELKMIYYASDIALHIESKDIQNRLKTRLSFSTKIIDCIFSSCAILAYCWEEQSGWRYLKKRDAAICVSNKDELQIKLQEICSNPSIIEEYAKKAYDCGVCYHTRETIQKDMMADFKNVIKNSIH